MLDVAGTTPLRVLVVEDSEDDALLLTRDLRQAGFVAELMRVDNADAMRSALEHGEWDIIIADHNMPNFSSTEAIELLKASGLDIPFIILSGSIGEDLAVRAMKAGAHDYIMKDSRARLIPAIQRELREAEARREHRRSQDMIRHMAYHDSLTELVNRGAFEHRLQEAVRSAHEGNRSHVLLYIDLDQFKIINDTCGHVAGDELLRRLAGVLREPIRDNDTLARLGGDEFGVLLEGCSIEVARRIAEKLLEAVTRFRFVWQDKTFSIGASIGMVAITRTASTATDLLSAADIACYAAKEHGRNRVQVFSEAEAELNKRQGEMRWVGRLRRALEENRLLLFRQPIVPLNGKHNLRLCELLLRLHDEDGQLVLPGVFIPAAERYGIMPMLDRWVVQAALRYLGNHTDEKTDGTCFINLSGTSINDESFFSFVRNQLKASRVAPGRLGFEVTETVAITDMNRAVSFIRALKAEGCKVSLDDFGSGMSSFYYLKSMPVDFVKIDGNFVRSILKDAMDCAIVESVIHIGKVAGVGTIAEFVETEAIQKKLQELGVDYGQGNAIAVPARLEAN